MNVESMLEPGAGLDDPSGLPVVINAAHAGYAPQTEVSGGVAVPAFDQASRIELILGTMQSQEGWRASLATPHGRDPILKLHEHIVDRVP